MVVLYFIPFLILLLVPREHFYRYFEALKVRIKRETLLTRGESLLFWLDSFGLDGVGFDLGASLPEANSYKAFGHFIHQAWSQVQLRGGELNPYFRVIKALLRVDLQRQVKESEALNLMRAQIISVLVLVWVFLAFLNYVVVNSLSGFTMVGIGLWQLFGLCIGFGVIGRLKKKYFDSLSELLDLLLTLHSLRFSGNLTQVQIELKQQKDRSAQMIFKRMRSLVERWKLQGSADLSPLNELLEDIVALSQHRSEKFARVGPLFFFIWSSAFVLPVLFASALLGLGSQLGL